MSLPLTKIATFSLLIEMPLIIQILMNSCISLFVSKFRDSFTSYPQISGLKLKSLISSLQAVET